MRIIESTNRTKASSIKVTTFPVGKQFKISGYAIVAMSDKDDARHFIVFELDYQIKDKDGNVVPAYYWLNTAIIPKFDVDKQIDVLPDGWLADTLKAEWTAANDDETLKAIADKMLDKVKNIKLKVTKRIGYQTISEKGQHYMAFLPVIDKA